VRFRYVKTRHHFEDHRSAFRRQCQGYSPSKRGREGGRREGGEVKGFSTSKTNQAQASPPRRGRSERQAEKEEEEVERLYTHSTLPAGGT